MTKLRRLLALHTDNKDVTAELVQPTKKEKDRERFLNPLITMSGWVLIVSHAEIYQLMLLAFTIEALTSTFTSCTGTDDCSCDCTSWASHK